MRVSDAERDRAVDRLRDHAAAGRLDHEEFEERVGTALAATTVADLDALTSDLPSLRGQRRAERRRESARRGFAQHFRIYVMVMTLLVVIWALTGMGYFWPVWPALGWGIGLASHRASLPRGRGGSKRRAIARV
ncbi:MAG: hypothetical protein QOE06_1514 [Thermoleophilaceae bacterium]|jgi:hypothetical protein|nr:hypothetical protein [Thermoleophilaceae bacterium]